MIPILNIYYLLSYAWQRLEEDDQISISKDSFKDSYDLIIRLLISSVTYICKRGLVNDYYEYEESIRGVKGKFLVGPTVKQNLLYSGVSVCLYDDYNQNTLPNQIIKFTLSKVLRSSNIHKEHLQPIKSLLIRFHSVRAKSIELKDFKKIRFSRSNIHYRLAIDICRLVLENLVPTPDKQGAWVFQDFIQNERKMAQLFEAFLFQFYRRHSRFERVIGSERIEWNQTAVYENSVKLPLMKADVSLVDGDRKIIIDAKYYKETLQSYFKTDKIRSGHLFQLYAYLKNNYNRGKNPTEGILIYPTVSKELEEHYQIDGHSIKVVTIDLNQKWNLIQKRLIEIIC